MRCTKRGPVSGGRRRVLALAVLALVDRGPLRAQEPASISIEAPRRWVFAGESLALVARVRDASGTVLSEGAVEWVSASTKVATVAPGGRVTGLRPGATAIGARRGALEGWTRLEVHPKRVELEPSRPDVYVGSETLLRAQALDAFERPLPGLSYAYASSQPAVAEIDATGRLLARSPGSATVTARVILAGLSGIAFTGQATVRVREKPAFLESAVFDSLALTRDPALRGVQSVHFLSDGHPVLVGLLSCGSQAPLVAEGGSLRALARLDGLGVTQLNEVTAGSGGDLFVFTQTLQGPALLRVDRDGVAERVPLPPGYHGWLHDLVANDAGDLAFVAGRDNGQDLLLRRRDGSYETVFREGDPLPGPGSPSGVGGVRLLEDGRVLFGANGATGWINFLWDGASVRRLCGPGDASPLGPLQGCGIPEGRVASREVFVYAWADGRNGILRLAPDGSFATVLADGQLLSGLTFHNLNRLLAVRGSSIAIRADTDAGGLFLLVDGTSIQTLGRNGERESDWSSLNHVALSATSAVLSGEDGLGRLRVVRVLPQEEVLGRIGQVVSGDHPTWLDWYSPPAIGSLASALFPAGARSLVGRLEGGAFRPVAGVGDEVSPGRYARFVQQLDVVRDGSAAMALSTNRGDGLFRVTSGAYRLIAEPSPTGGPGGLPLNNLCCGSFAASATSVATWSGWTEPDGRGAGGILLFREGALPEIVLKDPATVPGGGVTQGVWQVAIDDAGRVAMVAPFQEGGHAVLIWERGQLTRALGTNDPGPQGRTLQHVSRLIAAGRSFYVLSQYSQGPSQNRLWEVVELPSGGGRRTIDSGFFQGGILSANTSGDLAYAPMEESRSGFYVRRRDGTAALVVAPFARSGTGLYFESFYGISLADDGEVWFVAGEPSETGASVKLYRAVPTR